MSSKMIMAVLLLCRSKLMTLMFYVTVPYDINEVFWEAKNKEGVVLVQDSHDFYGDTEYKDIKECLLDIHDVMKAPKFRISNEGKTLEAYGCQWYYLFGDLNS